MNLNATLDVDLDVQLPNASADTIGMLSFQKVRAYQRFYTDARGSAMEAAAPLEQHHAGDEADR